MKLRFRNSHNFFMTVFGGVSRCIEFSPARQHPLRCTRLHHLREKSCGGSIRENDDANRPLADGLGGAQFTCFTGTKVQILTQKAMLRQLGLLLVFRTNSAYQRVYEARQIWGMRL